MPSREHESPLALVDLEPSVLTWLLAADTAGSLRVDPVVISAAQIPLPTDTEHPAPGAALMGTLAHANVPHIDRVFPTLLAELASLPEQHQQAYHDIVLGCLPEHARTRWRELMSATDYFRNNYRRTGTPYLSEEFSTAWTEGRSEGRAEGLARSVIKILTARNIPLTDTTRARIQHETDTDILETWLDRALTATTIDEVFTH